MEHIERIRVLSFIANREARIRHMKRSLALKPILPRTEEEERGYNHSQSHLARCRQQQRYLLLAYAFMRGKKYADVEKSCRHLPKPSKLVQAYSILKGEMPHVHGRYELRFEIWLKPFSLKKDRPFRINNPLPRSL